MTYDRLVEMDVGFDHDVSLLAAVLALLSDTVHESVVSADVIGADLPFIGIFRDFTKEDTDEVAGRDLELLGFDVSGPFVGSTVGRSGVVRERLLRGRHSPRKGIGGS